jgi:hypothetical protein
MKNGKFVIAAGIVGTLIASTSAHAVLMGLSVFAEAPGGVGAPPAGGPRVIWRVYADFSNTTDRVNAWGAGSALGPGSIQNALINGVTPGTGFTNIGAPGGQIAPNSPGTTSDWDTYMTIGVLYGSEGPGGTDATNQLPGTTSFITNGATSWTPDPINGGGVFITPDDPQGGAAYRVSGNDTDHRVLLMQLVVNAGETVKGTIGVAWQAVGQIGVTTTGLIFPNIPAAGGLPLLACAGLMGSRRRRA